MGLRKPIGGAVIVFGLIAYAAAVTTVADALPQHWAAQLVFFLAAGLLWVWPAALVVRWAQRT